MTPDLTARDDAILEMMARETAVMDDLVLRAQDPLGWLAVRRQARSFRQHLEPALAVASAARVGAEIAAYDASLARCYERSGAELGEYDPGVVATERGHLGLRVALIGKGGVGKTVLASTLARVLARRGRTVFAADLDTNPGLAISLGLGTGDFALPSAAVEENAGSNYGWRLAAGVTAVEAVRRYATITADGVHYLGLGKIGSADKIDAKQSVVALTQILLRFGDPSWDVIADLEAGPTTPFEGYHAFADTVLVVVGPSWQSALTARRLLPMVGDRRTVIVANRFRDEADHPGLEADVRIPFDAAVAEAERHGSSPVDSCPDSPVIDAVGRLADHLLTTSQEVKV
ncbi:MAG TPA: hypothetical protein VHT75_15495 [Acidimicrobiales bacterium]|nr:hypothetical protein [Acidimicrobiales bacterium]